MRIKRTEPEDGFNAFVLAAVIIRDKDYFDLENKWKNWKVKYLGSPLENIHEPQLRRKDPPFYFRGDRSKQIKAEFSLNQLISRLDFSAIACVINKPEHLALVGQNRLDKSLPSHIYLMTLDF
jgi:hypothetical protein